MAAPGPHDELTAQIIAAVSERLGGRDPQIGGIIAEEIQAALGESPAAAARGSTESASPPPTSRLVVIDLETGVLSPRLEIPRATLLNPRWSPGGHRITLALKDSTGQQDIIIFDLKARRWRFLYPTDSHHDNNPCWTADGRLLWGVPR